MHEIGFIDAGELSKCTERHRRNIRRPPLRACNNALEELQRNSCTGVVIEHFRGWPNRRDLWLTWRALRKQIPVYYFFSKEGSVELIDRHRFRSYANLFLFVTAYRAFGPTILICRSNLARAMAVARRLLPPKQQSAATNVDLESDAGVEEGPGAEDVEWLQKIAAIKPRALPIGSCPIGMEGTDPRIKGTGVYLRLDYWSEMIAGGSYGHTCHVANVLNQRTEELVCILGARYSLLDDMGVRQVVMDRPSVHSSETDMLKASDLYYDKLRLSLEVLKPAYVYERLVPGNFVGARICKELQIPYFVEYNGSEIIMRREFGDGLGFAHEEVFIEAEKTGFDQATAITVVSETVRDQVLKSGGDPSKILVNPNAADPRVYAPGEDEEIRTLRTEMGWSEENIVIGFVGTFGGWHGIEILADSLNLICRTVPEARFLMVGKGNFQGLVVEAVDRYKLHDRVMMTGLLPQEQTAQLMKLCDIFVSPHHRDMGDQPFFGSPTKVFEYMSMGRGIVASDLEQIGEVLSPALRFSDLRNEDIEVTDQCAVLCPPGDLDAFVEGVVGLCRRRDLIPTLGANARNAVLEKHTWDRHVDRFLDYASRKVEILEFSSADELTQAANKREDGAPSFDRAISTDGDAELKLEIQKQWDNDPCGSHYVDTNVESRESWFRQVESFRHDEFGPWMRETMEFDLHAGKHVLELGAGMGTDLAQFAQAGAIVTDIDLSASHLELAKENFAARGLSGTFVQGDGELLPFRDESFDLVYSNGVIHHTPGTNQVIAEIYRILKPGGKAIIMVYAENSIQYWRDLVLWRGLRQGQLLDWSIGEIMSRSVEISESGARPLVKVYRAPHLRSMFGRFRNVSTRRRQLMPHEPPKSLRWIPVDVLQRFIGWNHIVKAEKPLT